MTSPLILDIGLVPTAVVDSVMLALRALEPDRVGERDIAIDAYRRVVARGDTLVDVRDLARFLEDLAVELADDAIGVRCGSFRGFAGSPCARRRVGGHMTVGHVLSGRLPSAAVVMSTYAVTLNLTAGQGRLTWRCSNGTIPPPQFAGYIAALATGLLADLSDDATPPIEVALPHAPPRSLAAYRRALGPNIVYGVPVAAVTVDLARLAAPVPDEPTFANLAMMGLYGAIVERELRDRPLSQVIVESLSMGGPTIRDVAARLGVSTRTLQRKLAEHSTSFRDVVDATRRVLAHRLLTTTNLSLTDIAGRVGFAEPSGFSRAARQWWGEAPSRVRQRDQARPISATSERQRRRLPTV